MARRTEAEINGSPPIVSRDDLLVSSWVKKDIPPQDYLLGGVMCTTSRWFVYGETGIGKTLLGLDMAAGIASAKGFLNWAGQRKVRVMYLDGELPVETFKERIQLIAKRYGENIKLFGYNREDLGDDQMPPLNTEGGQNWLRREIDFIKPQLIVFDSIMCLLIGSMKEEESWEPMKPFVRELTTRHVAEVWLHHANEAGRLFGDKTRGWEMDTIVRLTKVEDDDESDFVAINLEFEKARLKTPENFKQFEPIIIRPGAVEWEVEPAARKGKQSSDRVWMSRQYLEAYDRLADGIEKSSGFDGQMVNKVRADAIRDELARRGVLDKDDRGAISSTGRSDLRRAKNDLLKDRKIIENDGLVWRI